MAVPMKVRKSLPPSQMGLPAQNKYPMPDPAHAANAKARATQMTNRGVISPGQKASIDSKANAILGQGHVTHNPDNRLPQHAMHARGKSRGMGNG